MISKQRMKSAVLAAVFGAGSQGAVAQVLEEVMVTAKAGSALLLNHRTFHGNFPNVGTYNRRMLAIAYRPAWAGPTVPKIDQWDEAELAQLPPNVRRYFQDRNQRGWDFGGVDKPANMASEAPGINPSRWD